MRLEFLQHSEYKDYARGLYMSSFPEDERRDFDINFELIETKDFDFFVIIDSLPEPKPIGIISIWYFEDYIYIEHFAIDENERFKGKGKEIIKTLIDSVKMPIIIEVEPPIDEITKKRVEFYEGLDFELLDYFYLQPPYSKAKNPIELKLMVYDKKLLDNKPLEEIITEIYEFVYGVGS
ncbi:MAG: GNAT family N-acetyltransferase [Bacteroidales bacterium]|nr:GNAT family N-acetyltransferase [Bacteroidales bacterium]